jgi:hypothetical protein
MVRQIGSVAIGLWYRKLHGPVMRVMASVRASREGKGQTNDPAIEPLT